MKRIPLYPFAFVSFVVLALHAANFRFDHGIGIRSLIILNIAAGISFKAFRYFGKDRQTVAYYAFNLFIFILFYGQFHVTIIEKADFFSEATLQFIIPAVWIFFQGAAILGWHKSSTRKLITEALSATCFVALFVSFLRIGSLNYQENHYYNNFQGYKSPQFLTPVEEFELKGSNPPDIYYLILDGYGRKDVLSEIYGYDNQPFLDYLSQRGFYIANQSHSNYIQTPMSIASSLNLNYILPQVEPRLLMLKQTNILRDNIKNNIVISSLKERGYTTIAFDSGFFHTVNPDVDLYITKFVEINVFEQVLVANTPLGIFPELFDNVPMFTFTTHRER
ncbi:MAG: hypothetical protein OEY93_07255, partial [Anaerolineae bacterium]|nr:hypothetical protein [Anaerolineae bacterium]